MEVSIDEKKKTMTIVIGIETDLKPSKSGKTKIVASTFGNAKTSTTYKGGEITIGLNAYIPNPDHKAE